MSPLQSLAPACALLCVLVLVSVLNQRREDTRPAPTIRRHPVTPPDPLQLRARQKPDWVRREVLRLAALLGPGSGCRSVARCFNRLHAASGVSVGKSFVHDLIQSHRHELACLRRDIRNRLPIEVEPNHTWAADLNFFTDAAGQRHALLGLIDHGSRLCLRLQRLGQRNSWALLGHLCLAIAEHGAPRHLRTDNEAVFCSRLFRAFLRCAGIQQQTIPTASPWCNGRMERFFGTLKPWLKALEISGAMVLQVALDQSRWFYNQVRPHQNLSGLTPAEKWQGLTPVDLEQMPIRSVHEVRLFDGLLAGYWIRR